MRARTGAGAGLVVLAATGMVYAGGAVPAGAASCASPSWVDVSSGSGHGAKSGGTPIRVAPSAGCAAVRVVGSGTLLAYDCWRFNAAGNLWTHVRIAGSSTGGWVFNDNLDDGGARSDTSSCSLPGPHG